MITVEEEQSIYDALRPLAASLDTQAIGARRERLVGIAFEQRVEELIERNQKLLEVLPHIRTPDERK